MQSFRNERERYLANVSGASHTTFQQAQALGEHFSSTRFTAIYASPLKRAFSTARAIQDKQPKPSPTLSTSLLLREQHFGIAEGKPWIPKCTPGLSVEEHIARDIYPTILSRSEKFPEGESLDDLAARAESAIREIILPHLWKAVEEGTKEGKVKLAIVSHGLCIREMIGALLRLGSTERVLVNLRGMCNTAWTRVEIAVKVSLYFHFRI
jgi:broad specificity phosphatase PhoE